MRVYKHRLLTKQEKSDRRFFMGKQWPKKRKAEAKPLVINMIRGK